MKISSKITYNVRLDGPHELADFRVIQEVFLATAEKLGIADKEPGACRLAVALMEGTESIHGEEK